MSLPVDINTVDGQDISLWLCHTLIIISYIFTESKRFLINKHTFDSGQGTLELVENAARKPSRKVASTARVLGNVPFGWPETPRGAFQSRQSKAHMSHIDVRGAS